MDQKFELVASREEVVSNVNTFNSDLPGDEYLQSLLSVFRHWYYIEALDAFGPSKFVGYKQMTGDRYRNRPEKSADGRETEHHLRRVLAAEISDTPSLISKLESFLAAYNKKPNALAKVHIFPSVTTRIIRSNRTTPRPVKRD